MKKLATIEIYAGKGDSTFGQSTTIQVIEGEFFRVEIDVKDEEWETSSRGISATDRQLLESSLVHELGHVVQKIMKNEPEDQLAKEKLAWKLGEKMGHPLPTVEKAAIDSYRD